MMDAFHLKMIEQRKDRDPETHRYAVMRETGWADAMEGLPPATGDPAYLLSYGHFLKEGKRLIGADNIPKAIAHNADVAQWYRVHRDLLPQTE